IAGIAAQYAANIADVVQQAGNDEVGVVGRLDAPRHSQALQYVTAGHRNQPRMLVVVIERVALSNAFDGDPGERTEAFRQIVLRGTKNFTEVPGQESAKLASRRRRDGSHRLSPDESEPFEGKAITGFSGLARRALAFARQ